MRKIVVLIVTILTVGIILTGCGNSNSINGKWQDKNDIVEFKSDGKFTAQYYWLGGAYTVSGDKLTLSPTMLDKEEYTYEINKDGNLILKQNGKEKYDFKKVK